MSEIKKKLTKAEVKKAAKEHGLFITENSNAVHAAKNLLEANNRLRELEVTFHCADQNKAFKAYCEKWWEKGNG